MKNRETSCFSNKHQGNHRLGPDFLWGTATSSHQVEGNNTNNDWWAWERQGRTKESSGQATRHYELFDRDFKLAGELNHNAHRFSIEWSRIEPQENVFDNREIEHYREVIRSLRKYHLEPIVTLHHFTCPQWFSRQNGWLNCRAAFWFNRYVGKIVQVLGGDVHFWVTINEPMVVAYQGYLSGRWPPGEKSFKKTWQVVRTFTNAHCLAYETIHALYQQNRWLTPAISVAQSLIPFKVCPQSPNLFCHAAVFLRHRLFNLYFLERIKSHLDYIGANYYFQEIISNDRCLGYGLGGGKCNKVHGHVGRVNSLFWDSYPEGLFEVLCWLRKFKKPILITENGTCEENDQWRWQFIEEHLTQLKRALAQRIPVIGYLYWSLLDNFEWQEGFGPRFGLVEVDYQSFSRTPRASAYKLAEMIKAFNREEPSRPTRSGTVI